LFSRNNRDITASYPDLARLPVADGLVLDGPVLDGLVLDEHGRPGFARLQQRMHVIRPSVALLAEVPVRYVVFDILRRAGRLLREEPFTIRRQILDDLRLDTAGLQVSPMSTYTPGELVMTAARQQGLEGVAANARGRATSPAGGPGRGSRHRSGTPLEVIIAGWSPSTCHPNALGSLLLAAHHG
jgi:bifunctional non-homologous end joining protein LigD